MVAIWLEREPDSYPLNLRTNECYIVYLNVKPTFKQNYYEFYALWCNGSKYR